jgi:hypothetical protein
LQTSQFENSDQQIGDQHVGVKVGALKKTFDGQAFKKLPPNALT